MLLKMSNLHNCMIDDYKIHQTTHGGGCKLYACCRCIVGRSHKSGEGVEVVADVGGGISEESTGVSQPTELATIQLSQRIDTVIIGSSGFWYAPCSSLHHVETLLLSFSWLFWMG